MGRVRACGGGLLIRGLVLAGGKSSRFGSNKAVARYQGVLMIERAVSLLNELALKPIVVARRGTDYLFLKCVTIYDKLPDLGPLGGLYTAMTIFKNTSFLVLTCDMPALTVSVLSELISKHETPSLITAYSTPDGTAQPFPAIYENTLLSLIREKLKKGDFSMHDLLSRTSHKTLIPLEGNIKIFTNINYPQELKTLETIRSPHS